MAKTKKDDVPNPNSVVNRDILQRMSFLYQASSYLNSISVPVEPEATAKEPTETPTGSTTTLGKRKSKSTSDLSRSYAGAIRAIGQKTMVKMDPAVKRTLCKGCSTILIPGSTATVRTKSSSSHGHAITYSCMSCKTSRRIPAPPVLRAQLAVDLESKSAGTDSVAEQSAQRPGRNQKKKKKAAVPRLQPLFERPGHIVFRGNERMVEDEI